MNLILIRDEFRSDGIFGTLTDENGVLVAVTLEHSFLINGAFAPKIPGGNSYTCIRGMHHLFKVPNQFETFEVTGVAGHTGLLFHPGNYNNDSEGCILVGTKKLKIGLGSEMIANSKLAFQAFMALQNGVDSFELGVAN